MKKTDLSEAAVIVQVCPSSFRFIRAQKSRTRRETDSFDAVMFLARVTKKFGASWPHRSMYAHEVAFPCKAIDFDPCSPKDIL